jgi:hypothetical protein
VRAEGGVACGMLLRRASPRGTRLAAACLAPVLVALTGCDLTAPAPVPSTLVVSPGAVELDALEASLPLSVLVRDEAGQSLGPVRATWVSEAPDVVTVSEAGVLQARAEGTARVEARFGEARGWATVEVRQRPGNAELISGGEQRARAGTPLPEPLRFRVVDRLGNPWAGRPLVLELPLGGSVSPAEPVTGPDGSVQVSWTLGSEPGLQSLTVRADGRSFHLLASATDAEGQVPFRIRVRLDGQVSPEVQASAARAVRRWEGVLAGKLAPVLVRVPAGRCGDDAPALDEVVDDLLVVLSEGEVDGAGGTAALATPCFIRQDGLLPIVGRVKVDRADVGTLAGLGLLDDALAHEVGHVLGVGTLWGLFDLLRNPSLPDHPGVDTHFGGAGATEAFLLAGGAAHEGEGVPVENALGGEGSRDVHWRQGALFDELMTTLLVAGRSNPLSQISAASLGDLGYEVRPGSGEPYTFPGGPRATREAGGAPPSAQVHQVRHLNRSHPLLVLDSEGRVIRSLPARIGSP